MAARRRPRGTPEERAEKTRKEMTRELLRNSRALRNLNNGFKGLGNKLAGFYDPVKNLTDVVQKQEKLEQQALARGTTYASFMKANTEALQSNFVATQALAAVGLKGLDTGLRDLSEETVTLASKMILAGESTDRLVPALGALRFMTADNKDVTASLSKTILETNRNTGVSTDKLVNALNEMADVLYETSIYGDTAVQGLAELKVALTGGLAGAPGANKAINQLISIADGLSVAEQEQAGVRNLIQELLTDGFKASQLEDLKQIGLRNAEKLEGMSLEGRQALTQAKGPTYLATIRIAEGLEAYEGTFEEMKAKGDEQVKLMQQLEQKKNKFFETLAPEIHSTITQFLPALYTAQLAAQGITAGARALGASRLAQLSQRAGGLNNLKSRAASASRLFGGAGAASLGSKLFGRGLGRAALGRLAPLLVGGPAGLAIGAAMTVPMIIDLFKGINDNTKKLAEEAEERRREKIRESSLRNLEQFEYLANLTGQLSVRTGANSRELIDSITSLKIVIEGLGEKIESRGSALGSSLGPNNK